MFTVQYLHDIFSELVFLHCKSDKWCNFGINGCKWLFRCFCKTNYHCLNLVQTTAYCDQVTLKVRFGGVRSHEYKGYFGNNVNESVILKTNDRCLKYLSELLDAHTTKRPSFKHTWVTAFSSKYTCTIVVRVETFSRNGRYIMWRQTHVSLTLWFSENLFVLLKIFQSNSHYISFAET